MGAVVWEVLVKVVANYWITAELLSFEEDK